jgi:myo-inositol-1(or 4)-monophosphatase
VACGRADAYFESGLQPWDIAAGVLLVREAGGRYCDFAGRDGIPASGNIVAGNHHIVAQMIEAVGPVLPPALLKA